MSGAAAGAGRVGGGGKMGLPPAISIIVPVLNESGIIRQTEKQLLRASAGFSAEILFVDGDPSGTSIKLLTSPRVRRLIGPPGRGTQMNAGGRAAAGSILVFVHADTRLPDGALGDVLNACRSPKIAGGAFLLGVDSPKKGFRLIEAAANLRCRLTRIPYGDQAVFIKKKVFDAIGGYAPLPLMEDIELMQRLKRRSLPIRLVKKAVRTSARRWEKDGLIYATLRNSLLSCLYYAGVSPSVLKRFYR